ELFMKMSDIKQFDDKGEELVDDLIFLGMIRPAARILCYLRDINEATSMEIESGTNLRQPEVSIGMKELKERDWVNEREETRRGKGRPYKLYSLKVEFNEQKLN
ncbi:MAG: ArsR family transcriptional regulator, partial [Candidatus Methanoperedens sp.]|nr:ArsR family transcriptional regulator [Candidatus Methanoperedens sp.]